MDTDVNRSLSWHVLLIIWFDCNVHTNGVPWFRGDQKSLLPIGIPTCRRSNGQLKNSTRLFKNGTSLFCRDMESVSLYCLFVEYKSFVSCTILQNNTKPALLELSVAFIFMNLVFRLTPAEILLRLTCSDSITVISAAKASFASNTHLSGSILFSSFSG